MSQITDLAGRRVTLWGLGTHGGGLAAAEFLVGQGARLTITDLASAATLEKSLDRLRALPVERYALGGHDEALLDDTELIVVNPAVPRDTPLLAQASKRGIPITSEIELFLQRCPATVVGVTGTNGKSSICTMLHQALVDAGRRAWLGGNIGRSLLGDLSSIGADDLVVLELSSFQLAWLGDQTRWPQGAIVTSLAPNHVDWHRSTGAYYAAKRRLLDHLPDDGFASFALDDPALSAWREAVGGKYLSPWPDDDVPELRTPGRFQRGNAALAGAVAERLGADPAKARSALAQFEGLPHRMQRLPDVEGRAVFNDSKSTTPAATVAALDGLNWPGWLILGGRNKGLAFDTLVPAINRHCRGYVAYGEAAETIVEQLSLLTNAPHQRVATVDEAFDWCWAHSKSGDAILFSPACTSFDQFTDFEARGSHFASLVARRMGATTISTDRARS
ncbi:MAG: hypothetical protein JSS27_20770 [Planctomycetes bacterium]|nr:hypothetical protein [Planctomycetota bacterium]